MPHKQVYGKRSRAIYDPFQAFASPQRPAPKSNIREQSVFVAEVVEELSRLKIEEEAYAESTRGTRKALGERNANETVRPVKAALNRVQTKRRRRKIVEQNADEENKDASQPDEDDEESSIRRSPRTKLKQQPKVPKKDAEDFVGDNVPLFLDGHGYETEGDERSTNHEHHNSEEGQPRFRRIEASRDSETPSISVLPPTPSAEDDVYTTHCSRLLKLSSHSITNFTEWSNQLTAHFAITKIAEASFGEVYRLSLLEDLSSFEKQDESVLKIIALKPPEIALPPTSKKKERTAALKKTEGMSKVEDVANEVRLLQRMSAIPGFTNFRDVRIMQGRPAQLFTKAFKDFNAEQKARKKDPSVFPDPAKKTSYADDQLWAVIEMQDAGVDLERLVEKGDCSSIWSIWDVFWQVILALAKGEEGAEFEHRDLHLGNICVRGQPASSKIESAIDTSRKLGFTDIEATIIDYTISRALLSSNSNGEETGQNVAYHDLSHPHSASIFEGDSTEEYQYDIYRYMRGCVLAGDPYHIPTSPQPLSPSNTQLSEWTTYNPRTNLIWLHYLLHSLLEALAWPSATRPPVKKRNAGKDFAVWKRANDLEHVLLRIQELLDPAVICASEGLVSAGALVGLALEEGWLDVGDVVGEEDEAIGEGEGEIAAGMESLNVQAIGEGDTLAAVKQDAAAETDPSDTGRGGRPKRKKQ